MPTKRQGSKDLEDELQGGSHLGSFLSCASSSPPQQNIQGILGVILEFILMKPPLRQLRSCRYQFLMRYKLRFLGYLVHHYKKCVNPWNNIVGHVM